MNNIPSDLRSDLSVDPYYKYCARASDGGCEGRVTWEHAWIYAGRQIQERWAIIPLCWYHHLGEGLNKRKNEIISLSRATDEDLSKYPKKDWDRIREYHKKIKSKGKRTVQQNRAIHLYFTMLAKSLNESGLDQRKVLKPSISIPWTPTAIKESLWRPIQKVMYEKNSTTELNKQEEITEIHATLMRHLGEKFGVEYIPFPSYEQGYMDTAPPKSESAKYQ